MNEEQQREVADLLGKALDGSFREVGLVTQLVPTAAVPAVWMHVSLAMLKLAAAMVAAKEASEQGRSGSEVAGWMDPNDTLEISEVRAAFRKILDAWKLAPDGPAVDAALRKAFGGQTILGKRA